MEPDEEKKGDLTTKSSAYGSGIYDTKRASSSVLDDASMMVRANYTFLAREVLVSDSILGRLKESSLIDVKAELDIQSATTSYRKNDIIIKTVLSNENCSDSCVRFLEIANNEDSGLTVELWRRLQSTLAATASASSSSKLTWDDVIKNKDLLIDELNPDRIVDAMYESKTIRTADHDSVIREHSRIKRTNVLLDMVSSRDNKVPFLLALESKSNPYLIKKLLQRKDVTESSTIVDVEENTCLRSDVDLDRIIEEFEGYCPKLKITVAFDEKLRNTEEIQTRIVRNTRRKQGLNSSEFQEMCTKNFNLNLDDVKSGPCKCILRLTSLSRDSLAIFFKEIKKGGLSEFIQTLLTDSEVKDILPHLSQRINVKITVIAKDTALQGDKVAFAETDRTFRMLLPHAVDRCHPQKLLDAFKKEEGIPKHFVGGIHISSRKFNRRDSMLMMLQQVYRAGTFITKAVNNYLIQCFGASITKVELSRCPISAAKQIQDNYEYVIDELDDVIMAILNDIASFFGESISMESTDRTPSRRMRAQMLLRDIMQSEKRCLDLINVMKMFGHGDIFSIDSSDKDKRDIVQPTKPIKREIQKEFTISLKEVIPAKPSRCPDELDLLTDFSSITSLEDE